MKSTICQLLVFATLLSTQTARADLVAYWNFNEGTGTTLGDLSSNQNNGTFLGGAKSWEPGHTTNEGDFSVRFNSGSSYVAVPHSASLAGITSRFTIAAWVYEHANTNYGHILVTTNNGTNRNWLWQTDNSSGGDQNYIWSTTNSAWQKPLGFTNANQAWRHFAFTYDGNLGSNQLKSYINGTFQAAYTVTGSPNFPAFTGGTLYIGGWLAGNSSYNGRIDDMVIFNSVEDVASIRDGTHPAMAASPYDTWAAAKGLAGLPGSSTDPNPSADPEDDGATNLIEFAFNGDPLDGSDLGFHLVAIEDSDADSLDELTLTLAVRNGSGSPAFSASPAPSASVDGITYTIEGSLDLDFLGSVVTETSAPTGLGDPPSGWEYRRFRLDASNGLPGRGFLRAKVTKP